MYSSMELAVDLAGIVRALSLFRSARRPTWAPLRAIRTPGRRPARLLQRCQTVGRLCPPVPRRSPTGRRRPRGTRWKSDGTSRKAVAIAVCDARVLL